MSSKKIDRAKYGPSWIEVILGAALSFMLGVVLAAVLLVSRPVQAVPTLPKELERGVVYYVAGSKDATKGRLWMRKRQLFVAGSTVALTEDELNAAFAASAEKGKGADAAGTEGLIVPGVPNFRFIDDQLQVGVPCTITVYGFKEDVQVIAVGGFVRGDAGFVFHPDKFYVGSLSVSRLPAVEGFVTGRIMKAESPADDLVAAWRKLSAVSVEGQTLKLSM